MPMHVSTHLGGDPHPVCLQAAVPRAAGHEHHAPPQAREVLMDGTGGFSFMHSLRKIVQLSQNESDANVDATAALLSKWHIRTGILHFFHVIWTNAASR